MRRGWVLAIVAACGAKAPKRGEPVEPPPAQDSATEYRGGGGRGSAERPQIPIADLVPDFHDELRWPLPAMSHPELEPHYPIARELAIDVGWEQLCARGVHRRVVAAKSEQLAYLRGWCSALEHDIDAACRQLAPLLQSVQMGIPEAVRRDLANILVGHGNADAAEGYIRRNAIRDVRVLDLLAASYAELGRNDDAFAINQLAIDADDYATPATKCLRLARHIVLMPDATAREFSIEALRKLSSNPKAVDLTCLRLAEAIACLHKPASDCRPYFLRRGIDTRTIGVLKEYFSWPDTANFQEWWHIGERLRDILHIPGAIDLALAAYEASIAVDGLCAGARATSVNKAIVGIRALPSHAEYEPRLLQLANACPRPAGATAPGP